MVFQNIVDTIGDEELFRSIVDGTVTEVIDSNVEVVVGMACTNWYHYRNFL